MQVEYFGVLLEVPFDTEAIAIDSVMCIAYRDSVLMAYNLKGDTLKYSDYTQQWVFSKGNLNGTFTEVFPSRLVLEYLKANVNPRESLVHLKKEAV